jgi:hypothetical protein
LGSQKQESINAKWFLFEQEDPFYDLLFTINDSLFNEQKRRNTMKHPEESPGGRNAKKATNTKTTNNKISKRSNVMNTMQFLGKVGFTAILLLIMTTIAIGGDLKTAVSIGGSGSTNVNGDVINTGSGDITIAPTIRLNKASGTQAIWSFSGKAIGFTGPLYFYKGGNKNFQGTVSVSSLYLGDNTGTSNDFTGAITKSADSLLTITGSGTFQNFGGSNNPSSINFAGTVTYSGNGINILNARGSGATYSTLNISGTGTNTIPAVSTGTVTISNQLNQTNGSLAVSNDVSITGGTGHSIATLANIASGKSLAFSNASAGTIVSLNNQSTGTLSSSSSGTISISGVANNTGSVVATGGTINFTGTNSNVAGTIDAQTGGIIDFDNAVSSTGTVQTTGSGHLKFGNSVGATTLTFATGSTVTYDQGTAGQALADKDYGYLVLSGGTKTWALGAARAINNNLTVGSASTISGSFDLNVTGNVVVNADLTKSANAITFANAGSGVSGTNEIIGGVKRTHAFTATTPYTFNRGEVYLTWNTGQVPDNSVTLTMDPATDPSSPVTSKYATRKYSLAFGGTTGSLSAAQLYYGGAGDLTGSPDESQLGIRSYASSTWSKMLYAGYTRSSGSNVVTLSGLSGYALTNVTELGIYQVTMIGSSAGLWSATGTWDEGAVPTSGQDVQIAAAITVDATPGTNPGSVSLGTGGSLTLTTGNLTITNGLSNTGNGAISVASGQTLAVGGTYSNNSSGVATFTGDLVAGALTNTSGTINLYGTGTSVTGAVSNAGTLNIGDGSASSVVTLASTTGNNVTSSGTLAVTANATLNVGDAGDDNNNLIITAGSLTVTNALNVYGDLDIQGGTITNNGTITVAE